MEKEPQKRMECFWLLLENLARIEHQFLCSIRNSRKAGSLWGMMSGVGGVMKSIHQSWLAKGLGLRDSVGRGQHSSNRVNSISTRTMHQSTTPSLSQTIWPRSASRQFFSLPIVQALLPVTLCYSLSSEAVVCDNWGDDRACDEGHWYAHTSGLPWVLAEVVGTVQVHWSRWRLLRRGLEFHVCTINKSGHTKKSGNLSYASCIYIYIYIYICMID